MSYPAETMPTCQKLISERTAENWALGDSCYQHSRDINVDAENSAAVDLCWRVQSRNRLTDEFPLATRFQLDRGWNCRAEK
jgi:hypothetical protein